MEKKGLSALLPRSDMDKIDLFDALLSATRRAYLEHPEATGFAPFPADITPQAVDSVARPAKELLRQDAGTDVDALASLRQAVVAAADVVTWLDHYQDSDLGPGFHDRFGCFPIIGDSGPFISDSLRAWVVYMAPNLYYPWHEHVAEELYLVISGSAVFRKAGSADVTLRAGDTVFHGHNQPHATETGDEPVLCLVLWRDDFAHAPVLSDPDRLEAQVSGLAAR